MNDIALYIGTNTSEVEDRPTCEIVVKEMNKQNHCM